MTVSQRDIQRRLFWRIEHIRESLGVKLARQALLLLNITLQVMIWKRLLADDRQLQFHDAAVQQLGE